MITPRRPAGFNELLPADQMALNAMISIIRLSYEQHGYAPIETPALELSPVLLAKEGGETAKQVYRFSKGDNDLAMRFDLTIPLARYTAEHYHELTFPFRRYQIQEVWRAEKPQAGRYRQFYQCDIDIVGVDDITADADVLITARNTLKALDLKDAVLKISHRGLLTGFLADKKLDKKNTEVLRIIDKLDKQGEKVVATELAKLGLKKNDITELLKLVTIAGPAKDVLKKLPTIKQPAFTKALLELTQLNKLLTAAGLKSSEFVFDLSIARGLDYYTGMVFETVLTKHQNIGSVCSGGRYDNLLEQYHKEHLPGVGASIGLSRLFSAIKDSLSDAPANPAQVMVISFESQQDAYALSVVKTLHQSNLNAFLYPGHDKIGKQLKYADKLGITFVALVGSYEVEKEMITIKNLKSGEQKQMKLSKAVQFIRKNL